jgi:hypothetical protein
MILFDCFVSLILIVAELTFYHPSLAGGVMRSGAVYNPGDPTIVAVGIDTAGEPLIPLGTKITICRADLSRCADAVVQDTGLLGENLDASEALFEQLAPLSKGRIKVVWRRTE